MGKIVSISENIMTLYITALMRDCHQIAMKYADITMKRYDGSGYPDGLKVMNNTLCSGSSLVDAYDALVSVRPIKEN